MSADIEGFRARLQQVREEKRLSARALSMAIGKGEAYIQALESGLRNKKLPSYEIVSAIARELGVDPAYLVYGSSGNAPTAPRRQLTDQELFERFGIRPYDAPISVEGVYASAGPGAGLPQDIDDSIPREYARTKYLREVTVHGDCMVPDLYPGEVVVYNTRLSPEIGKIMVALRDEEELIVKRLVLVGDDQFLHPNEGMNIRVDDRIRFLGRAVAVTRRLL
jgi:transcriptional regulator with XRE-family HTH domain